MSGFKVYQRATHEFDGLFDPSTPDVAIDHFFGEGEDDLLIDVLVYDGTDNLTPSTTISDLPGGQSFTFVASTISAVGDSNRSLALVASTCPPAPSGLVITGTTTTAISLQWTVPVVTTGQPITGYRVFRNDCLGGLIDQVVVKRT